jgi:hypothetical protein
VTGAYLTGIRRSWAKTELNDTRRNLAKLVKARDAAKARDVAAQPSSASG